MKKTITNNENVILTNALIKLIKQHYIQVSSPCNLDRIPYIVELLHDPLQYLDNDISENLTSEFDSIVVSGNYHSDMLRNDLMYAYDFIDNEIKLLVNAGKLLHMIDTNVDSDYENDIIDTQREDKYYMKLAYDIQVNYFKDFSEVIDNINGMGELIDFIDEVNNANCEKQQFVRHFSVSYKSDNIFVIGEYNRATVLPEGIYFFKYVPCSDNMNDDCVSIESVFSIRLDSTDNVVINADKEYELTLISGDIITIK